jgi:transcriptional regulator with XRE-family HTH domain
MTTEPTTDSTIPCPGLAVYRTARGLTQRALGAKIGKSRRTVQRYEEDARAPLEVLQACAAADVLNVPLEMLTEPMKARGSNGRQTVRDLARLARRYLRDCERVRSEAGPKAYGLARERVVTTQPDLGRLIPE